MNPWIGWSLAVIGVAIGYAQYGWRGVALVISVVVFWLLLQFTRAARALRAASGAPVGYVDSAVMLHTKLRAGMRLMELLTLTRSLGRQLPAEGREERFEWTDASGARLSVTLVGGRVSRWALERPPEGPT